MQLLFPAHPRPYSEACWKGLGNQVEVYSAPEILLGRSLAGEDYTLTLLEGATRQNLLV